MKEMESITQFVERLSREVKSDSFFTNGCPTYALAKGGRKYLRVVMTSHGQDSVWGFIERETGNIFKAAGWKAPAKHVRGNIETAEYGFNYSWTGPNYLR